ncbi:MAG: hypothetical protein ACR2FS_04905 [Phormidesmis sp.]
MTYSNAANSNAASTQPVHSPIQVTPEEYQLLNQLRDRSPAQNPPKLRPSLGERIAD